MMACSHQHHPCCPIQGHIWNKGFKSGAMTSELFRDVPDVLTELRLAGVKSYIYSSGSREAQKLFFGHSQVCDGAGRRGRAGAKTCIYLSGSREAQKLFFGLSRSDDRVQELIVLPNNSPL